MKEWIFSLLCTGLFLPLLSMGSTVSDPEIRTVELNKKVVSPGETLEIRVCYEQPEGGTLWGYAFSGLLSQLPQGADKVFKVIRYKDARWDNAELTKWKYFTAEERNSLIMQREAAISCKIGADWPDGDYSVKVNLQFRHPEYQMSNEQREKNVRYVKESFRFTVVRNQDNPSED